MVSTRSTLDEIVESFSTLEVPRSHINRRHPLPSILVLAVLAVLAGAAGPTAIAHRGLRLVRLPTTTLGPGRLGRRRQERASTCSARRTGSARFAVPWAVINDAALLATPARPRLHLRASPRRSRCRC